ncbi:MAG: sulfite exporter TauE/SafE family protein [Fibrobacteria bacterium]|nr:sulfite exporter TauE/SafE family protein [Fibrobacteria bacterium]
MEFVLTMGAAIWLGILTSISPCPLATNIAAISFIGRQVENSRNMFLGGLAYILGRTVTYILLGSLLVYSTHAVPAVSLFLQNQFRLVIGPFLIIIGILLLGIIPISFGGGLLSHSQQTRMARYGVWGAFLLGIVFALAFCPVSAALFFGNTLGLAAQHNSRFLLPTLYGVGTALPVIVFAWIIAFSAKTLGKTFNKIQVIEKWVRKVGGLIFIVAGIYSFF